LTQECTIERLLLLRVVEKEYSFRKLEGFYTDSQLTALYSNSRGRMRLNIAGGSIRDNPRPSKHSFSKRDRAGELETLTEGDDYII